MPLTLKNNLRIILGPKPEKYKNIVFSSCLVVATHAAVLCVSLQLCMHFSFQAFKFVFAERTELGDPKFEPSVQEVVKKMLR